VVISAQRAPRRSITALVAIVVPCRIWSRSSGLISAARSASSNPIEGSFGVDGTLMTRSIAPVIAREIKVGVGATDIDAEPCRSCAPARIVRFAIVLLGSRQLRLGDLLRQRAVVPRCRCIRRNAASPSCAAMAASTRSCTRTTSRRRSAEFRLRLSVAA
jgi:hypothetical protein